MKVLLNTHCVTRGDGQGRVNYEIASHLAARGHQVTLLADRVAPELAAHPHIHWQRIPAVAKLPDLARCALWARACTNYLKEHGGEFDILHLNGALAQIPHHVNTSHFVHGAFRRYLQREPSPGIRSIYHRLHADVNARLERQVYQLARVVVAVSPKTKRELAEIVGIAPSRLAVICNGVDGEEFYPDPAVRTRMRAALGIPAEQLALLYVGEFTQLRKGLRTVLEAMHSLPEQVHLYVAGRGRVESYSRALAPVRSRVHFLGFRRDIADLFRAADVFVFPSRYDSMPLVVLEALASGLPVVTTQASGFGELMEAGREGFVVADPYDAAAVSAAVTCLLAEPALAHSVGHQARALAGQFDWRSMAEQYEVLYENILSSGGGTS